MRDESTQIDPTEEVETPAEEVKEETPAEEVKEEEVKEDEAAQ